MMNGLPPKLDVALHLLEQGLVCVYLDPRGKDVILPPHFKNQPRLMLHIGLNLAIPIPDLHLDEQGITCTLSFERPYQAFYCVLPWRCIFALVGEDGRGMSWPDDVPLEVQLAMKPKAEPQRPRLSLVKSGDASPAAAAAPAASEAASEEEEDAARKAKRRSKRQEKRTEDAAAAEAIAASKPKGKKAATSKAKSQEPEGAAAIAAEGTKVKVRKAKSQDAAEAKSAASKRKKTATKSQVAEAAKPVAAEPEAAKPVAAEPEAAEPVAAEPEVAKPTAGKKKRELPPYLRLVK